MAARNQPSLDTPYNRTNLKLIAMLFLPKNKN